MIRAVRIYPVYAPPLAVKDECALLAEALQRQPAARSNRLRLASLLSDVDAFDEAISLLTDDTYGGLDHGGLMLLASAAMARKAGGDALLAKEAVVAAIAASDNDAEHAQALLQQAKLLVRENDRQAAIVLLEKALTLDPENSSAFERLAIQLFHFGRSDEVLALTTDRVAAGEAHPRFIAAHAMALAKLGRTDEAHAMWGAEQFLFSEVIAPPDGWETLSEFNAALAQELAENPSIRAGRYGTASRASERIDAPATAGTPAIRALLAQIATIAESFAISLHGMDHPWVAAMPERAVLKNWCVMTGPDGYENWHMHPAGWLSGGYYPQVPDAVVSGEGPEGCLAIGLSKRIVGAEVAATFGQKLVRPAAGTLTLFPSHIYHRTYPHKADGKRVCIAFDICPA